ncbi:[pt] thiamine biosynthesis ThiG [Galdieria sulphuraria]|uniref:Thiazole synthase n=1 Tax=Galdieria sulphuraria TaxID=130081 RepID=M2XER0_GALSU|nr:thiamin biosynthesis protein G [Galdieria sulphuraria]XP_005704987.1 [pt] thiamine biosynthesis ThiG [Galdieria sulphuraria]AIG92637.1 thiamin biosynthesis protein G [Galdieria sulphuraria]EME28467.1 [pt] thiamine biosynthesis ThiG [Galdieria sulphuraria]|eukprot:XP_005704987.1 [pt] thiamine biosynthesis ThiG [Galdieria sulphuraria]
MVSLNDKHIISSQINNDHLIINNYSFKSRLLVGTGKYRNIEEAIQSIIYSDCNIITIAIRRAQNNHISGLNILLKRLNWKNLWLLPNTAGCKTSDEAIRIANLGREIAKTIGQENNNFVKLEVIPDSKYLLPDPIGTLKAAEVLVNKGFTVLPYINADPILAKQLESIGCATIMPLGSPIGSAQGLQNISNIQIIIENAKIPVIIDAGIGAPSEASKAMELGAAGILTNTAIAKAKNPPQMALAMNLAIKSGRIAYLSGLIRSTQYGVNSSPYEGIFTNNN